MQNDFFKDPKTIHETDPTPIERAIAGKPQVFRFVEDPGHGWLEVPRYLVEQYGIADKISSCSYQDGKMVYLEEDCDMALFWNAYKARHDGADPEYRTLLLNNEWPGRYRFASYRSQ